MYYINYLCQGQFLGGMLHKGMFLVDEATAWPRKAEYHELHLDFQNQ